VSSRLPTIRRVYQRGRGTILDLSDSANLYLTPTQGRWFEEVLTDAAYKVSVAEPLSKAGDALPYLLGSITPHNGHRNLTVIDCGPATAEESVRKLQALKRVITVSRYVVVDINSRLLSKVKAGVTAELGLPVTTLQTRFEELDSRTLRHHAEGESLLLFGSTGMNYGPATLRRVIRRFCFSGLLISFESLLRSGKRLSSQEYESDAVVRFAFGPLWLLGATLEQFDFQLVQAKDRLRLEFVARRAIRLQHPGAPRLHAGDRVWTAFSRRPTLSEYQTEISRITGRFEAFVVANEVVASLGQVE
jgi:hypothetical protein